MNPGRSSHALAVAAAVAVLVTGGFAVVRWLAVESGLLLGERVPTDDPGATADVTAAVDLEGRFETFPGSPSAVTSSWPRFRGADFDNISKETVPLAETWPAGGPPVLWSLELGDGHAGPAVRHGRVYLLDYDEKARADALRCFSFDDGRELWRRSYAVDIKRNHGISRTVPAVSERHVLSLGPRCHVLCVDALTGDYLWGLDLVREYGTKEPLWYTAQCPLLDGGTAILAPGGKALMVAIDAATGRVLWQTPNPDGWEMSHASIVPMEFGGRRMWVYPAIGGVVGVAADGPNAGEVLWTSTEWKNSVTAPSPVILPEGRVFLTAGYGGGSILLQLRPDGARFRAEVVWRVDKTVFGCEQQTPVFVRDHLFTVMPNDAGALKRQLACYHPRGQSVWSSGPDHRFGLGPFLAAGDRLFILDDEGTLTMARVSTQRYEEMARAEVLPKGRDAWGPLALVDGRLLARESKRMVCLDLRKR
jgi:outer membrane protein assembly factor BamB